MIEMCPLDNEEIEKRLDEHEEQILELQKTTTINTEKLRSIEKGQEELKNEIRSSQTQHTNLLITMTQTLSNMAMNKHDNHTQLDIARVQSTSAKETKKLEVWQQVLILIGTLIAGANYEAILKFIGSLMK